MRRCDRQPAAEAGDFVDDRRILQGYPIERDLAGAIATLNINLSPWSCKR